MTWPKLVLIVGAASLLSAGVLALVSRTPASVRSDKAGPEATSPELGSSFTDEQIARHGAYRGPTYLAFALRTALPILLLVLLARGPFARLVDSLDGVRGGWFTQALLLGALLALMTSLVTLPMSYVLGYASQHAWGLSTQSLGGWISDQVKGLVIGGVIAGISAAAFFGIVRWQPRSWWVWGWAAFTALTALLVFLYPVLIAPLFNKFTPLEDRELRDRIITLGREAGVDLDEVLVADASKRTTGENAYVAGIGSTKRMVLYDTLLEAGDEDETLFVTAHELGHRKENHVAKGIVTASIGLLLGFGVLYLLSKSDSLWRWGGADGVADLKALPLLLLYMIVATLVLLPVENAISRANESKADEIAIELTDDPATAVKTFRRLAFSNLADLKAPEIAVVTLFSHPPIPDRIDSVLAGVPRSP